MVEEIVRVEPQLFGSQVQHTSIARKMELWRRIVDRVNAVGQHPRNREDIRKRWNDLRGKVRSAVSRHNIAVQRTGGGPPLPPPQLTTWEEQVLTIMHPEGLGGVGGGMDTGSRKTVTTPEGPDISTPPTEEAHSDDSSSALLEPDDQPGPSWASGQSVPLAQAQPNTDFPPSGGGQAKGTHSPRGPILHHGSIPPLPGDNGDVLVKFQETQRLQEEQYLGFREELRTISSALGTIVGVLKDIQQTLRDTVALQGAPDASQDDELPTTSAGASGQDAPPQDNHTNTPPPADGQPPRKRSLRSRNRTEQDGKTPARK
ncbi:hypothetical protein NDU88_001387 [Pleurodeles waltl]|uniref:Myb/SANT-like DNA-binding domain-containing protein n=1 Tax=Pleurodeles waltl TaxID=8319 RepID=A0AAV7UV68_PLEWA|nr:hypothetical protein NDU88_001387 [Pleurodeles waltl]